MPELVELDEQAHRDLRIREGSAIQIAANQHVINIRASELPQAVTDFPVFFTRDPNSGDFSASIVTSFDAGQNLYVANGEWNAIFMPSSMQTYPLFLMKSPTDERGYTVGIDEANSAFSTTEGQPLFEEAGKATLFLSDMTRRLQAGAEADVQTLYFIEALQKLELLKPVDVLVHYADDAVQTIRGLLTIDEERLKSLPSERVQELYTQGYLVLIHAVLISIYQLNGLIRRQGLNAELKPVKSVKLQVARDVSASE
ncbi:MAG: SapC family protein [Pseudomonadota bacterium]